MPPVSNLLSRQQNYVFESIMTAPLKEWEWEKEVPHGFSLCGAKAGENQSTGTNYAWLWPSLLTPSSQSGGGQGCLGEECERCSPLQAEVSLRGGEQGSRELCPAVGETLVKASHRHVCLLSTPRHSSVLRRSSVLHVPQPNKLPAPTGHVWGTVDSKHSVYCQWCYI